MSRIESAVQRRIPSGRLPLPRSYLVRLDALLPVIHLVHRRQGELALGERLVVDHELVYVEQGAGHLVLAGKAVPYRARCVLAIPPFVAHAFRSPSPGPSSHLAVHFDPSPHAPPRAASLASRRPYAVRYP